jgi:hypothetical protein
VRDAFGSQPTHENGMFGQRAGQLLVRLTAALGIVLCLGPDTSSVAHALTAFAFASLAMLTTAVGARLFPEWQTDVQSRQDWAQLGLKPAQLSFAVELTPSSDIDPRYLATTRDEALRHDFLTHRAAEQAARRVPIQASSDEFPSVQLVRQQGYGSAALLKADTCEPILRDLASAPMRAARISNLRKGKRRTNDTAPRLRLVANGDIWPNRSVPTSPRGDKIADVIVLNNRQREHAQDNPKDSVVSTSAESTAQPPCRGAPRSRASRSGVPADPVVRDKLGQRTPIGREEPRLTSACPVELANSHQRSHSRRPSQEGARHPNVVIADLARLLGRLAARQDFEAEEAEHARRHLRQVQQRPTEPDID